MIGLVEYVRPSESKSGDWPFETRKSLLSVDGAKLHASLVGKKNQTVKEQLKQLVTDCMHSLTKQA